MSIQPPRDLPQRLEPLLGAIARLIAKGVPVTGDALRTLLLGVTLDGHPEAGKELERWSNLLSRLRLAPSSANRYATEEALRHRGLGQASVVLAIATVAPGPELKASKSVLNFGVLKPGAVATQEVEVWGSAGEVVTASDYLSVTPRRFGVGRTRLRVQLQGVAGATIYTQLELVSTDGKLILPVIAESASAPSTRPPLPPLVRVRGVGGYRTLEEALQKAEPGATLDLSAGEYILLRPLVIDKSIRIEGANSYLFCRAPGIALRFLGQIDCRLSDLTLRYEGLEPANVIELVSARLVLEHCSIESAVGDGAASAGGIGMMVKEGAQLNATFCRFTKCQRYGLLLSGKSQAYLKCCRFDENGTGLLAGDSTRPTLKDCECLHNEGDGLLMAGKAVVFVDGGRCEANGGAGIALTDSARGSVLHANCRTNLHGIEIRHKAHPLLESNGCERNRECGILIGGSTPLRVIGNVCTRNSFGINVANQAPHTVLQNRCSENSKINVAYFGAEGAAKFPDNTAG